MSQEVARLHEGGNAKLRVSRLPFSKIPDQSRLFLQFLKDPRSLSRYYPNAVDSYTDIRAFIPEVLAKYKTDRNALCEFLFDINAQIGAGRRSLESIELLRDRDTVAVVTGQQAGLFTGPIYTIYKALSAVSMAEYLNQNGAKAVPVFWAATEDHDFDEVSRTYVIGGNGELLRSEYSPSKPVNGASVGAVQLDGSINDVIENMFAGISRSAASGDLRETIEHSWKEGNFFGRAFEQQIASILSRFGIIFVDPMNDGLKQLATPIYVKAIEKSDEIVAAIREKNRELESEGFHSQVLVEPEYFSLFRHTDDGKRVALRRVKEGIYRSKDECREFNLAELAEIAVADPQRFSPGVMLRPVVQDHLLPTACYFGGAAEIAYFAQNVAAYRCLDRPVTPILHRQSFTVVDPKCQRTLDKFGMEFSDMFSGYRANLQEIGSRQLAEETLKVFEEATGTISGELDRIEAGLSKIDPTVAASLDKRRNKILYHLSALKQKAVLAQVRKDDTTERQLRAAFTALLPEDQLQERIVNVNSFVNKYGPQFIDWIYESIDLSNKDHQIIFL